MDRTKVSIRPSGLVWVAAAICGACTGLVGELPVQSTTSAPEPKVDGPIAPELLVPPPKDAAEPQLRRLSAPQLAASVRDVLGIDDGDASEFLIPIDESTIPSLLTVERLRAAAAAVTSLRAHHRFVPCAVDGAGTEACAQEFIETFAGRVFRRPLTAEELDGLMTTYREAQTQFGFVDSLDLITEVIFQSPQFVYVFEEGRDEPGLPAGLRRLTSYELATRLSYFLWDTTPDDALLAAAASNRLDDDQQLGAEVERMLADPRAKAKLIDFVTRLMELDGTARHVSIEEAVKDPNLYPLDNPALRQAMRKEIGEFVGRVLDEGGSISELFLSRQAYVNGPLAQLYGLSDGPSRPDEWSWVTLPSEQRAGVATRAAFLFVYAAPDIPSPIRLGAAVWRDFFCYNFPPPPPEAADVKIVPGEGQGQDPSIRRAVENKTSADLCRGCHSKMNPAGFAFGHYDAIGQWQDEERGTTPAGVAYQTAIDASSQLIGSDVEGAFDGAIALSAKLAESRQVRNCFGAKLWSTAFGRAPATGEEKSLAWIQARLAESGSLKEALVDLIQSPGFRYVRKAP